MDVEYVVLRVFRAVAYAAAAGVGLYLAGAPANVFTPIALVVCFLQLLNIITYWASVTAGLLLIWGGLTSAGVTPGVAEVAPLARSLAALVEAGRPKPPAEQVSSTAGAPVSGSTRLVAEKLESLKSLCEKNILTQDQCDAAKAKIIAELTK